MDALRKWYEWTVSLRCVIAQPLNRHVGDPSLGGKFIQVPHYLCNGRWLSVAKFDMAVTHVVMGR